MGFRNALNRRRTVATAAATAMIISLGSYAATAGPVTDAAFEGADGDLDSNGATDWNDFAPVTWTGDPPMQTGSSTADGWELFGLTDDIVTTSDSAFSGGVKQDDFCASTKNGKAPNKDDLERVYVASKTVEGDVYAALAWARIPQNSTSASAHVAFEFNQGEAACGNGTGLVEREPGDVLTVYDFEGGDQAPTLKLSRWLEASADVWNTTYDCEITGAPPEGDDADGCWGNTIDLTGSGFAEARVNTETVGAVDTDLPPTGSETLGIVEFGEAIINLTDAGVFGAEECVALGSVFAVSRSSGNSGQAQMKDLVGPGDVDLSNCGQFTIEKELTTGETAQEGDGNVDFPFTVAPAAGDTPTSGFTLNIGGSETVVNVQPGQYVVTETPIPTGWNLDDIQCSTGGVPTLASDLATLTVTADSDITCTFYNSRERGSIQVEKLVAGTAARVDGATFVLDEDGKAATTDDQTTIPAVSGQTGLHCIDDLLFGDYNVLESSPPTGYSGDSSVAVVTVDSESTCAERAADDVDASFQNKKIPAISTVATSSVTVGETIFDTATLSKGYNPTGMITFTAYSDDKCTNPVFTDTETVNGNGDYTTDPGYVSTSAGTIYWIASYSGDGSNEPASGACLDANESSVVAPAEPDIETVATAAVTVGETIFDTATLSKGYNPTGMITFTAYSDDKCTNPVFTDTETVNGNGDYTTDPGYVTQAAGTIYWIASYSGDDNNDPVSGACGDPGESSVVGAASPSIGTTPVLLPNDSAVLSGGFGTLTGTIVFELHDTLDCSGDALYSETQTVNGGGTYETNNTTVFITADGTYSWEVTYSGDANNNLAESACALERYVVDITPDIIGS